LLELEINYFRITKYNIPVK